MCNPEQESVEAYVAYLLDEERSHVTYEEVVELSEAMGQSVPTNVIHELQTWGIQVGARPAVRRVRGFQTSSNDRWFGPGSAPTSGGSGWEQIAGFAGQRG